MGATYLETRMKTHCGEAREKGYIMVPLHVPSNGQRQWCWWMKLLTKEEFGGACGQGQNWLNWWLSKAILQRRWLVKVEGGVYRVRAGCPLWPRWSKEE